MQFENDGQVPVFLSTGEVKITNLKKKKKKYPKNTRILRIFAWNTSCYFTSLYDMEKWEYR